MSWIEDLERWKKIEKIIDEAIVYGALTFFFGFIAMLIFFAVMFFFFW